MEQAGYSVIVETKCDCCGEMTEVFSNKTNWWGKYLKDDEKRICPDCIKQRKGYKEEYYKQTGITL